MIFDLEGNCHFFPQFIPFYISTQAMYVLLNLFPQGSGLTNINLGNLIEQIITEDIGSGM